MNILKNKKHYLIKIHNQKYKKKNQNYNLKQMVLLYNKLLEMKSSFD